MLNVLKAIAKRTLPVRARMWLRQEHVRVTENPPFRCVQFGDFRRVAPIHAGFGIGRGRYIDRYYIERFLEQHAADIRGRVLELSDNEYTMRFGRANVTHSDVLDIRADHPHATIIADLADGNNIPSDCFDCIVLTQALNFIYDTRAVVKTLYRILKPGGCVLVSVAGITAIAPDEWEYCGDYWRFTRLSLQRLFEEVFPAECVRVESHGNVLAATAFLHGLAVEELEPAELDYPDPNYEVSVLCKAVKPTTTPSDSASR